MAEPPFAAVLGYPHRTIGGVSPRYRAKKETGGKISPPVFGPDIAAALGGLWREPRARQLGGSRRSELVFVRPRPWSARSPSLRPSLRGGCGVAAQVLVKLGADLGRVRQQVIQLLSGYQGKEQVAVGGNDQAPDKGSQILDQFGRNLTAAAREGKACVIDMRVLPGYDTRA